MMTTQTEPTVTPDNPEWYNLRRLAGRAWARLEGRAEEPAGRKVRITCPECYGSGRIGFGRYCPECGGMETITVTVPAEGGQ